ncbi:MAG: cobalt-precorrin-6A reductase [Pseudomonadota bacterium]
MNEKILILGGTKEAAQLAKELVLEVGEHAVITSLAGRTKEPKPLVGKVRIGGFGGVGGLADYLATNAISRVIDATHPFAEQISANAVKACQQTKTPLDVRTRQPWERQANDNWIEVSSLQEAREHIPDGATALLAIGAQHLNVFNGLDRAKLIARTVDGRLPEHDQTIHKWIKGVPSLNPDDERKILVEHAVTHIICRNSGGKGAYAKIEAARILGLPVIIVQRQTVHT